jgi:hypothetical protein
MTLYTHNDMPGLYGSAPFTLPDGRQFPAVWWRTSSPQERAGLGFRVHEAEPEVPTLAERKAGLQEEVRAKRWAVETGGLTVGGAPIRTDEASQSRITAAVNLFAHDETLQSVDWEAQHGVWVEIDRATMIAIGVAVGRHVQQCFSHARALSEAVEAAEDEEALDAIDIDAGWPV